MSKNEIGINACENLASQLEKLEPYYTDFILSAYATFSSDTKLNLKTKELIIVAALVTQKGAYPQLKGHLSRCRKNGLSKAEVCAAMLHLTMYIGYPSVINTLMLIEDVYNDDEQ